MPFGSITLQPGVNVERTPTALTAGFAQSQLIRFRDGLVQKYGGWARLFSFAFSGIPRDLHAWEDLSTAVHLLVGTTNTLGVITGGALQDVTPRTITSDFSPNFSTVMGSHDVTVTDPNISNLTVYDTIIFNTPVSVGGIILTGIYPITVALGGSSYKITAATAAEETVNNGGAVPQFTTSTGSTVVTVTLEDHGITTFGTGTQVVFLLSSTGNGVTIFNDYTVNSIVDADNFTITASTQATAPVSNAPFEVAIYPGNPLVNIISFRSANQSLSSFFMNHGRAEIVYYITQGPPPGGTGYGLGGYGAGGYGVGGSGGGSVTVGTPITTTDWTSDNWGEFALACATGSGVFLFDPTAGFLQANIIPTAPPYNGGIFVSTSEQILVCWGSTTQLALGVQRDPLLIKWSDVGDFTDFVPLTTNQAGSFRIPKGTQLRGGMALSNQNLIWTELDCWVMNYLGPPFVFGFNQIGIGAGLISSHAAQGLRGNVYWMGPTNFYVYSPGGISVLPCPVWDFVFQNLNTAFTANVRAMPNTPFNEVGWFFPSAASVSGECDSYVKFNVTEQSNPWDFGPANSLQRSAWMDQSILGMPIGANTGGIIYQHETTNDADGQALNASFTTGYFFISEGEDFAFVDQILPDFRWGFFGSAQTAQVMLTFNVTNYPGDTPVSYGPYTVTQATEYLSVRFRGRQMSITVQSSDVGSFWRIGRVRYRWAPSGRR